MSLTSDRNSAPRVSSDQAPAIAARARRRRVPLSLIAVLYAAFEGLAIMAVAATAGAVYYVLAFPTTTPVSVHVQLGALIALLVVAASALQGSYRGDRMHVIGRHPDQIALSVIFGLAALVLILFASKRSDEFSRVVIFISAPLVFVALLALRAGAERLLQALVRRDLVSLPKILLVGARSQMAHVLDEGDAPRAYTFVGIHEVSSAPGSERFEEEVAAARDIAKRLDVAGIVLCLPWSARSAIQACAERLAVLPCALYLGLDPALLDIEGWPTSREPGSLGQIIVRRPLTPSQLAVKRAFDIAGAGAGVVVLSPLLALLALAIKIDSAGPVLFRQQRYGYNRMPFSVYKFRTMTAESSKAGFRQATRGDMRVTRIGRFLRRASLDELPQLFNVLGGSMSLVGPRPHPVELDEQYTPLIQHYATRHKIKPGITGWAQVKGHRGETRSTANMADRISHDLYYLNHWSFWLDIKILLMTLTSVASQRNAV